MRRWLRARFGEDRVTDARLYHAALAAALLVCVAYAVALACVATSSIAFLSATKTQFQPSPASATHRWSDFTWRFPIGGPQIFYNALYVVVSTDQHFASSSSPPRDDEAEEDYRSIVAPVESLTTPCRERVLRNYTAQLASVSRELGYETCVSSFFTTACTSALVPPATFLADDNATVLIMLQVLFGRRPTAEEDFLRSVPLQAFFDASECPVAVSVHHAGILDMTSAMQSSVLGDLAHIDAVCVPLALALAALCLRSLRLLGVTLLLLLPAIGLTFAALMPLTSHIVFSTVTPEVVAAMVVALTIDYSLFLLSRFRELLDHHSHRQQQQQQQQRMGKGMMGMMMPAPLEGLQRVRLVARATSACTVNIVFSGTTVAAIYATLLLNANDLIKSVAAGCAVGAACSMLVALTLAPSLMLLLFTPLTAPLPSAVDRATAAAASLWARACALGETAEERARKEAEASQLLALPPAAASRLERRRERRASPWFRAAALATRHPWPVLALCLLIAVPACVVVPLQMRIDFNIYAEVPTNAPQTRLYRNVIATFGPLISPPFNLEFSLLADHDGGGPLDEARFAAMGDIADRIRRDAANATGKSLMIGEVMDLAHFRGERLTLADAMGRAFADDADYARHWRMLCNDAAPATDARGHGCTAALITIYPSRDSLGADAFAMYAYLADLWTELAPPLDARAPVAASAAPLPRGFFHGVFGADLDSFGCLREVYRSLGPSLGLAAGAAFLAMLAAFHSLFIALRLLVTVAYTWLLAFAAATVVFCFRDGNPLREDWNGQEWGDITALQWVIPVIATPMLAALAVDYDGFVVCRVVRLRVRGGFSDAAAVVKAVHRTGRVVSFAALTMAVAFGSLMLSHCVMLQQFGLILLVGVVVDAFVVRVLLVPALLAVAPGVWMWWPLDVPSDGPLLRGVSDDSDSDSDRDRDSVGDRNVVVKSASDDDGDDARDATMQ